MIDISILLDIGIILLFAKAFGAIAERLNTDAMVGELLAGLLLGPVLLWVVPGTFLENIAFLGLIVLMFFIGLDVSYEDIKKQSYAGGVMGTVTVAFAFLGGLAVGFFVFQSLVVGGVLGVAIMGTSTVVPLKLVGKAGMIKTKLGQVMISMAMADDIATIVALSLLSKWIISGNIEIIPAISIFLAILGFILVILAFGSKVVAGVLNVFGRLKGEQIMLSIPLALAFLIAYASNELGIAAITGAFLAGVAMSGSKHVKDSIEPKMRSIGYGFFIPIFFTYSALIVNLQDAAQFWWILAIIVAVAISTKVLGVLVSSGYYGFRGKEIGILALSTVPRGEYSIAIIQLALGMGIVTSQVYSAVIGMAITTIILAPLLFKIYTRKSYYAGF